MNLDMGRPKTVYLDLPPRMTARRLKSGKVLFYYQSGRTKLPLGADLAQARLLWAQYENGAECSTAFKALAERYRTEILPKKALKTRKIQGPQVDLLIEAFGKFPLDAIEPKHVREYIDRRTAKVAANREIALLSHFWNWAREIGATAKANPCAGVRKNREVSRGRYVTNEEFSATYEIANRPVRDAMDLALLTGQRVSDVLKMTLQDIADGCLWVVQAKTGARLGIRIEGRLKDVLERIQTREGKVASIHLVHDDNGQRVPIWRLQQWFKAARTSDWQFRDLRAKAATDSPDLKSAQNLLGHRQETTTAAVYRRVRGNKVSPLK